MTPSIETKRLLLVPYAAGMVTDTHVAWLNDPEVVKFSEQRHKKHTLGSQHEYLNKFPRDSHIWLIKLGDGYTGVYHIGTITAHVDAPNKVANMGILIGQKGLWGQGYGEEAWTAVMDWLFDNDIRKVESGCMMVNAGMVNICTRSGMTPEGSQGGHFLLDGKPASLLNFGKFAP